MSLEGKSLADLVGRWQEPGLESGLIDRVRSAWTKPISTLTNHELATCLRQSIATEHLIPVAKERVQQRVVDGSELDDEELAQAIEDSEYREMREREHRRIIAARFHTDEKKG